MTANKLAFYAVLAVIGIAVFVFFDDLLSWILDNPLISVIAGGGGATAAGMAKKRKKAVQESKIYDDMRVDIDEDVVNELIEADRLAEKAEQIADEITEPKDNPKPGTTRKSWDIK